VTNPRWIKICCALLWFTAAAWAEPYLCPDGRFSAELSQATVRSVSTSESPLGTIATHVYLDRQPGRFLTVSFTDLPKLALLAGRETLFEEARDGMLDQCHGHMLTWTKVDRQTRRLTYQVNSEKTYRGETLFRLEKYRLYVIDARSEASLKAALDRDFFNSFKIFAPAAAAAPLRP
jgi:hypothetical protein